MKWYTLIKIMELTSTAFKNNTFIPKVYTCDGDNINPPLQITNAPADTKSFVLVMDDSDIPEVFKSKLNIEKFNHWSVYNIPSNTTEILPNASIGLCGLHTRGEAVYTGPCPPTEYEPTTHRYSFRLYALSGVLEFTQTPTLDEIETQAQNSMLAKTELIGLYSRVA